MKSVLQFAILGAFLWLQPSAQATPVLDLSGNGMESIFLEPGTGGWTFHVNSLISVSALGVWDENPNGLVESHAVGIWSSTGTLLTSATINNAGTVVPSACNLGRWIFTSVTPIQLAAGDYTIGAAYAGSADQLLFGYTPLNHTLTVSTIPEITYGHGVLSFGSALSQPTMDFSYDSSVFGPNFSATPIPEPATFALLGLALAAGLAIKRRRNLHS